MTPLEMAKELSRIDLNKLSDEELYEIYKFADSLHYETSWRVNSRKQNNPNFPKKRNN